ncbi:MAG: zf-HC2 domain-containing protein [Elusimicrobia bacterium]|nr:zf-HC2 domain-containing protein [Elusimicrobiota bacterium]
MNHHADGPELSAYLDGALAPEPRARVELHMSSCGECRAELDSLRHMKLALSSAPRRTMPADLVFALERRFVSGARPWYAPLVKPMVWAPAGALAVAAIAVSLWLRSAATLEEIPLEPLLAAHARYSAEALVPEGNLVASNYSDQVSALSDAPDSDLQ